MFFGTADRSVGLELDTGAARAVELTGNSNNPKLAALGAIILPPGAVEEGMVLQPEEVGRALKTLWSARGFKGRDVVLGISNQAVLVRYATMPKVPLDKLDSVVRFNAQEYLPLPLASVVLDYLMIGEITTVDKKALEVLLVAARRDMLEGFLEALAVAELEPRDIDVSSLPLSRVLPPETRSKTIAIVNASNGLSNLLITTRGVPRLARLVSVKMKDIADQLSCPLENVLSALVNPSEDTKAVLHNWIDGLAGEIHSSINYYQSQEGAEEIEEIFLNGRGARLPGIFERLEANLNVPVRKSNPVERYITPAFAQVGHHGEAMEYGISAGLAHRGLEGW